MAKQKSNSVKTRLFSSDKTSQVLSLHTSFVYEIEIFRYEPGRYNLEDSKTIASKTFVKDIEETFFKDDVRFRKHTRLIAAPLKWLTENKFTENLNSTDNE